MKTKIPRPVILATLLLLAGTKTSVAGVEIEYRYYTPDSRGTLKEVTALNFANQVSIPNDFYQTITSGFRSGDAADALGAIEESNGETEIKIHVTIQSLANRTTVVRYDWEADGGICKNPQFGSMSFREFGDGGLVVL